MDISRPDLSKKHALRKRLIAGGSAAFIVCLVLFLLFYRAGPTSVDGNLLLTRIVTNGDMTVRVRGVGSLVPEEVRWITARSSGQIEKIHVFPGAAVTPETVIMEISNPELIQQSNSLSLQLKSEEANYQSLKSDLNNRLLSMEAEIARLEADSAQADLEEEINTKLFNEGLESRLSMQRAILRAGQLKKRLALDKKRQEYVAKSVEAQLRAEESRIDQTRDRFRLIEEQKNNLKVRAEFSGILQRQTVQVGQRVNVGASLSQVADPESLKASVRVPEAMANDVNIGQDATIDFRNFTTKGKVTRIDPNVEGGTVTVDIAFEEEQPDQARPDLTVEGIIEIQHIENTTYVYRPAYAKPNSSAKIFKLDEDGNLAHLVKVEYGYVSIDAAEIKSGLKSGDSIIVSDMSSWKDFDTIKIKK